MSDEATFDPRDEILVAADGLAALATTYEAGGRAEQADHLYRLCADIELRSPALQACWGGPLNGQAGRQRIMDDLIARYRPTCILETGTFRGLTTDWFARRFSGPILTCEASKRYFYQAERNLAQHGHVSVVLADSRPFLADLDLPQAARARPLVYLDAHWEQDLPLREELKILLKGFDTFVAVIDDFRVPGDDGYTWDDYGGADALTVDYIAAVTPDDCDLLFPTLPAGDETGARRGCCVVSRNVSCALEDGGVLVGGSLRHWQAVQARQAPSGETPAPAPQARQEAEISGGGQVSYPDLIAQLHRRLKAAHSEAAAKEAVLQDLKRVCDERQGVIDELATMLNTERSRP